MRVKTSNLSGRALDWAVAYAYYGDGVVKLDHGFLIMQPARYIGRNPIHSRMYSPSARWTQGGPIIESERIDVFSTAGGTGWCAQSDRRVFTAYGNSPLVAAMRCYVASRLGDEVEVPDELLAA